ncbi:Transcription elongation factor spt6, partial [Cladochytrium tenue]
MSDNDRDNTDSDNDDHRGNDSGSDHGGRSDDEQDSGPSKSRTGGASGEGGSSKKRKGNKVELSDDEGDDVDDSSEEESDGEMTEADKQFIVDDEEEVEDEAAASDGEDRRESERRKRKRKRRVAEEDLDDEDLELLDENYGRSRKEGKRRLRKKGSADASGKSESRSGDLADRIFNQDDERDAELDDERAPSGPSGAYEDEFSESEADSGFVVDDELGEGDDSTQLRGEYSALNKEDLRREALFIMRKLQEHEELEAERLSFIVDKNKSNSRSTETAVLDRAEKSLLYHKDKLRSWRKDKEAVLETIGKILEFFNQQHFEVPFLIAHRKDYFYPLLDRTDLWKIYDLDAFYHSLSAKKEATLSLLQDLRAISEDALSNRYPDKMLDEALCFEDVQDVLGYLHLHFGSEMQRVEDSRRRTIKRSIKRSAFEDARRAGLGEFLKLFNVDVRAFSQRILHRDNDQVIEDHREDPLVAAERFVVDKTAYSTAEKVLEAGRTMLALEIASDPVLRKFMRKIYDTDAVVSVTPTEKGKREIQHMHPYYPFKYLTEKPVFRFDDAQFLEINAAEAAGLVEVVVRVEREDLLLNDLVKHITNDYTNEYAERWNEERKNVAMKAAKEILFPQVSKWLKEKLASDAADWLAEQCRINLEHKIDVAPFKPDRKNPEDDFYDNDGEYEVKNLARVMAISWGEGERDSATIVICLDERGFIAHDGKLKLNWMNDRDKKIDDLNKILVKMREFKPDVVVVSGWTLATGRLMSDLAGVIARINDDDNLWGNRLRDRGHVPTPQLVMIDDDVARLKMSSAKFAKEFPDLPPLARYCVSLGRKVQDTTMEYASLFNTDEEIKLLRIHPKQNLLSEEKLKSSFERAFINVVNFNGVDINDAALYAHRSYTLQFVSGLGPRKAAYILNGIIKLSSRPSKGKDVARLPGILNSRNDLVLDTLVTWNVFLNCASFVRVRRVYFLDFNRAADHDILDDTRIHPEDYDLARKMAADALELDDVLDHEVSDSQNVYELMTTKPEKLDDLLLDDYAVELEKRNKTKKKITLNEIKDELKAPYRDRRRRFASMTYREMFTMLSNETEDSLRPGTVVTCMVTKVLERLLRIRLNSGLEGIIHISNLPDKPMSLAAYAENQVLRAAVKSVDIEHRQVELDARPEVVQRDWMKELARASRDEFFNEVREEEDRERKPVVPRSSQPRRTRVVNHPFWRNCTFQEAVDELSKEGVRNGSIIIRPSTKGNNHLSITWKIGKDLFQHIDVVESNKENEWSLGKVLSIEDNKFDDLDEIIAMYIEPLFRNFNEAVQHPKFKLADLKSM